MCVNIIYVTETGCRLTPRSFKRIVLQFKFLTRYTNAIIYDFRFHIKSKSTEAENSHQTVLIGWFMFPIQLITEQTQFHQFVVLRLHLKTKVYKSEYKELKILLRLILHSTWYDVIEQVQCIQF